MYLEFYGLREAPFSITPDPRFVYLSERHRDALAHLLYGIGQGGGGGFVQLTGEVGTGKTTLCRLLLEQLPENTRVALVLNPKLSPVELLETVCEELRLEVEPVRGSLKGLVDTLNRYLLDAYAQGLRVVLIIDEAQELSREALEQVRLLTNLETPTQKLLQILLLGQPELRELLAAPDLRQLNQRITARYHLMPLDAAESEAYVRHRLAVAGAQRFPFTKLALRRLHAHSGGVPRLINVIAERALLAGYAREQAQIGEGLMDRAAAETVAARGARALLGRLRLRSRHFGWVAAVLLAALLLVLWSLPRWRAAHDDAQAGAPAADEVSAATPAAPGPAPEVVGAEAFLERIGSGRASLQAALRPLLALWMVRADEADVGSATDCPPQLAPGLFCLRSRTTLSVLSALGRPALVQLSGPDGEGWGLLLAADARHARLALAGETLVVDRVQFERLWTGSYLTVWRAPAFVELPLSRGDRGPAADWLHDRLDALGAGLGGRTGPGHYGAATAAAVRRLQEAVGLRADGVVGPETLLALTADDGIGPQLRRDLQ
ncbi:ExeA family protein [Coralloluteibacterium stylophorae]|uniref:AAA family ATPase n=1 Tax=Coralloluteibacterium stylophorae TaxID=1776034 RepID=A0A8J8AYF3_9GAMM|nr:ExeA family protein [Coralloluteibacterium stylophorae]MBS7458069.1 AAA family ATPase [Coralloluteibacterium stylophorae]